PNGSADATGNQLPGDWRAALSPSGIETRMGDAIKAVLDREQGSPLAGVIVVTDGRSNAGLDPRSLVLSAQNQRVPLYFVGVGSEKNPPNMKLVEIDVPKRIYPGDKFSMNVLLQSSGFAGKSVAVQVTAGPKGGDPAAYSIEAEVAVSITTDDELATATFELDPKAVGVWSYVVKLIPLAGDVDARDDSQQVEVAVIERKNRVLIFAGGPMREYQFVRNLMFRDRDVESHVLLQTGRGGISQEAQRIVTEFPADRTALSQYDAILAFDADWTKVSDAQAQALEQWVAEQAGGLLIVAGNVEMPKWLSRASGGERSNILRTLSPVTLVQSGSRALSTGRVEAEKPWPIKLTNDGLQSDFLWLSDDPTTSAKLWDEFEGVYSYNAAFELKPGAKKLAVFGDPTSADDGNLPIYLASQFYGAGRVVYQGGAEMWRLRELGDMYFDRFYTKLVRWISSGRLMMDSDRGILLVDRETALLGDQVTVRAVLKDQRFQPLIQSEVYAQLLDPQKRNMRLVLRPLGGGVQPGVYTGQFPVQVAGDYTVQLQLGGLASNEVLQASVKARVPAIEMQGAERHDALLLPLATQSGGRYFKGAEAAIESAETGKGTALAAAIVPQDQISFLPGVPNRRFQLRWLGWLMGLIAGCLTIEWFARRLHRLA
ncbi:MAG: VWA domain-containing protein, partial [Pirellulaceae bacterium]|nr:VWA domain-containing protein [Pirellulaceae bacterium]